MGTDITITIMRTDITLIIGALIIAFASGYKITEELKAEELLAFSFCDQDGEAGLTWEEVENCEKEFAVVLAAQNIPVPTKRDFNSADLNGDGILFFQEWEEWVRELEMKVGLVDLVDTSSETVSSQFGTSGTGDQSLTDISVLENRWGFDLVPFFLGEWINDLLFASLFSFGKTLIFTNSHFRGCSSP